MDKEEAYEQIRDAVGELKALDAIGIGKAMILEKTDKLLAGDKKGAFEVAALLRLVNSAEKELNLDELDPEERKLLSGNFIKSLEGVKWYLFGGDNRGGHE